MKKSDFMPKNTYNIILLAYQYTILIPFESRRIRRHKGQNSANLTKLVDFYPVID